jgi:TP901 family phage tail tape measure protein
VSEFLPPVVAEIGANVAPFTEGMVKAVEGLQRFVAAARETNAAVSEAFAAISRSALEAETTVVESSDAMKTSIRQVASAARALGKAVQGIGDTVPAAMGAVSGSTEEMASAAGPAFTRVSEQAAVAARSMGEVGAAAAVMAESVTASTSEAAAAETRMGTAAVAASRETAAAMDSAALSTAAASTSAVAGLKKYAMGLAGAAFGVYETAKAAMHFETQMTRLDTAAGLSDEKLRAMGLTSEDLNRKVLALGNQVGVSGTEMAEALYHPISASLDLASALEVAKYSAMEMKISGASLDDTTYALSSVMKAFNQQASDAGPTMASLNAIVGQGDMRFQDFNESVKNWAPTAAQMGISIDSMGAGLAYLTDRGNSAEVAATRLTMGLSMMTTPSAQAAKMLVGMGVASMDVKASSDAMQQAMEKAHITQNDLAADLQKPDGLYVALNHLKTALEAAGVSGTEADSVLAKIFGGGRSDKAIMSLLQNLDGLKEKYNDITKAASMDNFGRAFEKSQQTFQAQMEKMKATFANLGIEIGSMVLPYLSKFFGWIRDGASFLTQHMTIVKMLAGAIGGLLVGAIVALGSAIEMTPIGWIATGLMAAGAAVAFAWTHFALLRRAVEDVGRVLERVFAAGVREAAKALDWFRATVLPPVRAEFQRLTDWLRAHKAEFVAVFRGMVRDVELVFKSIERNLAPPVKAALRDLFDWLKAHKEEFKTYFHNMLTSVHALIVWFAHTAMPALKDAIKATWDWFRAHKDEFRHAWESTLHAVEAAVKWFYSNVLVWLMGKVREFIAWWKAHSDEISTTWSVVWGLIRTNIIFSWDVIKGVLKVLAASWVFVWGLIKDTVKLVWATIRDVVSTGIHWVQNTMAVVMDLISGHWAKAWTDAKHMVKQALGDIGKLIMDVGSGFATLLYDAGRNAIKGLVNGMKSAIGSVRSTVSDIAQSVKDFWPWSPAKTGPLSGNGSLEIAGRNVARMLATGMTAGAPNVAAATAGLAGTVGRAIAAPAFAGAGVSAGRGGTTVIVHHKVDVHVAGSVLSERDLRRVVEKQMADLGAHNSTTWTPYGRR